MKTYLVLDLGGSFIKYALLDENAVILEKDKLPTPGDEKHTLEDFLQVMDEIVEQYKERISGIAVSMPGMLDSTTGYCRTGGKLVYFQDTPARQLMEARYDVPVSVENDGKCAALAELWKGSLKGHKNAAVIVLGTGVGGGIVIDGKLYRGSHFTAGEYSYVVTDNQNPEKISSCWGLQNGCEALAKLVAEQTGEDYRILDGICIFERANKGEEKVLAGLKRFTNLLALQIYNLNIILDLEVIAIGGGISQQPLLIEYIRTSMKEYVEINPIREIVSYVPVPVITNCTYYNDANLIGALYHYKQLFEGGY